MRKLLLTLIVTLTFLLAGCTSDGADGDGDNSPEGDPTIAKGASLGEWTETIEGGPLAGAETTDTDLNAQCDAAPTSVGSHPFTLPAANDEDVPWKASTFTVTLHPTEDAPGELDLYLFDSEGNELAANFASDLMGENPHLISVNNLASGDYTVEVHACAPSPGYTLDLVGTMVASQDVYAAS